MATTDTSAADAAALQALMQALRELQAKTEQLERKLAGNTASAPAAASPDVSGALLRLLGQQAGRASDGEDSNPFSNDSTSGAAGLGSGFDQKAFEIIIDQMVAQSLLRGRETSGVLRTLFGLVPALIGR